MWWQLSKVSAVSTLDSSKSKHTYKTACRVRPIRRARAFGTSRGISHNHRRWTHNTETRKYSVHRFDATCVRECFPVCNNRLWCAEVLKETFHVRSNIKYWVQVGASSEGASWLLYKPTVSTPSVSMDTCLRQRPNPALLLNKGRVCEMPPNDGKLFFIPCLVSPLSVRRALGQEAQDADAAWPVFLWQNVLEDLNLWVSGDKQAEGEQMTPKKGHFPSYYSFPWSLPTPNSLCMPAPCPSQCLSALAEASHPDRRLLWLPWCISQETLNSLTGQRASVHCVMNIMCDLCGGWREM